MALIVHFSPSGMDMAKYRDVLQRLEKAGAGSPPGRLHHCCYEADGKLKVVDVFDSKESFDRFGQTLIPILKTVGVDVGQPTVNTVQNIIVGR